MSRLSALSQAAASASSRRDAGAALDACTLLETLPWEPEAVEKARFLARISGRRLRDDPRWYVAWERCMRWLSWGDFRCFMSFIELDRPAADRFWAPREKCLAPIADALQAMEDGRLDELIVNVPPRIGKTTLMVMWSAWRLGRHPEDSHLYTSYSDTVTKAFYGGVLEVLKDPDTYRWGEVFPASPLVRTDAFNGLVDVGRRKRYASLTCRSIDGTLNGACDASGALIGDDLCSGIEEASNPQRLERLLSKVNNDWLSRRKHGCPIVWMGTRWSVNDPMGVRERTLSEDPAFKDVRWRKVSIPAVDDAGRSNFYMDGRGFSKPDYDRIRSQFERAGDTASWLAMYMQQPVERQGALFDAADLRTFSGEVPDGRAFMAVDPAFGGGDYTAAPVCVDDGEDVYVPAVVFSDREKDRTLPMLADAVERWHVEKVQFEANRMLESYVDEFKRLLKERGTRTTVVTRPAQTKVSKDERIHGRAPDIRQRFVFLDLPSRPAEYRAFMDQVCSFTSQGRVPHDDAPDSLAMAAGMVYRFGGKQQPAVFGRIF